MTNALRKRHETLCRPGNHWFCPARYRPGLIALLLLAVLAAAAPGEAAPGTLEIGSGSSPALALNNSRLPVIVYSNDSLVLATCPDLACPAAMITAIPGTSASAQPSLALTATGQPVISYYNTATRDLMLAACASANCASATVSVVDSDGDVGQYSAIQLTNSGTPVISYYDASSGDLKLAVCTDPLCINHLIHRVDRFQNVGQFTALRLNNNGTPVISYYAVSSGDLKLAICNNAFCTRPRLSTVDRSGNVGQFTALAINSSGRAIISYYDATHADLKLAICTNSNCTHPILRTVDRAGSIGQYTSLALDAGNRPTISYFAPDQQAVRLALCGDTTCANSQRLDIGQGLAGSTAVARRSPRGIYAAFVNSQGKIALYADIPTPTGCYIDAPSTVNEGTTFSVTVRCDGLAVLVYGFEIGLRATGSATPAASYTPGSFVISAESNILDAVNRIDSYAVSRRNPALPVSGSFSLATLDLTATAVRCSGTITLSLNKLLLGDIQGAALNVPALPAVVVTVRNVS